MKYEIANLKIKDADIIITPDTVYIVTLEIYRGKKAILEGYKTVKDVLSKSKIYRCPDKVVLS
jgi:hypothetical protein